MKSVKISRIGRRKTSHDIEETDVETERRPSTHRRREGSKGRKHEARHLTRDEDERANED